VATYLALRGGLWLLSGLLSPSQLSFLITGYMVATPNATPSTPASSYKTKLPGFGPTARRLRAGRNSKEEGKSSDEEGTQELKSNDNAQLSQSISDLKSTIELQTKQLQQLATENAALRLQVRNLGAQPVEISLERTVEYEDKRRHRRQPAHEQIGTALASIFGLGKSSSPSSFKKAKPQAGGARADSQPNDIAKEPATHSVASRDLPRGSVRMRRPSWVEAAGPNAEIAPDVLDVFQQFGAATGHMTVDNLSGALGALNIRVTDAQAEAILQKFDEDENGTLEREEFAKLSMHLTKFTSFSPAKVEELAAGAQVHEVVRRASTRQNNDFLPPMVQTLDTYMAIGKTGFSPRERKNSVGVDASTKACVAFLMRAAVKEFQSEAIDGLLDDDESDEDDVPRVTV
jgi:regulator of replication initiation timing